MPLVKKIRQRGGQDLVIEANAEILFLPTGEISRFNNSLSQRTRLATASFAPSNKRPRWAHYGKPLKDTIRSSTAISPERMQAYWAVGSTAHYSGYVDQGTGVYAGHGPYLAKILPPWTRMSPSLYEHTWRVPVSDGINDHGEAMIRWEEIGKIAIKGQKGQAYFARGLYMGLKAVRLATHKEGGPRIEAGLEAVPDRLTNFSGATPWSFAFDTQLREWRAWRDAAWHSGKVLGLGINKERERREYARVKREISKGLASEERRERAREGNRIRQERYRRSHHVRTREQYDRDRNRNTQRNRAEAKERETIIRNLSRKYGANFDAVSLHLQGNRWEYVVKIGRDFEVKYLRARFLNP